jgi:hypothetical protein
MGVVQILVVRTNSIMCFEGKGGSTGYNNNKTKSDLEKVKISGFLRQIIPVHSVEKIHEFSGVRASDK